MSTWPEHLSPKQAAAYAGVDISTIKRWLRKGTLTRLRRPQSSRVYVSRRELELHAEPRQEGRQ